MTCVPYNPAPGEFRTSYTWGTIPSSGLWKFQFHEEAFGKKFYHLLHDDTFQLELRFESECTVEWIYFGGYLAVRSSLEFGGPVTYTIQIIRRSVGDVDHYEVEDGNPHFEGVSSAELHFHSSVDNQAFFLFLSLSVDETTQHWVYRTDTGTELVGFRGDIENGSPRAEITDDGLVIIRDGRTYASGELPHGELTVSPAEHDFRVVLHGPPELATSTREFTLKNDGDDCLTVSQIGDVPPFTYSPNGQSLPRDLDSGDRIQVKVTFAPTQPGDYGPVELPITYHPEREPRHLRCVGRAEEAEPKLIVPSSGDFGTVPVGQSGTFPLTIRNEGQADLHITFMSAANPPFAWTPFTGVIPAGQFEPVQITFTPSEESVICTTIELRSNDPDSPHEIQICGRGCIPDAAIDPPSTQQLGFGDVQQGFRTVRMITIKNIGDGPLEFRASFAGDDAGLFGLQPLTGDIFDVTSSRDYTVDPVTACGSIPVGSGETIVAVAFHANDVSGNVSAELVIDHHNATNTNDSEWRVPLQANITDLQSVDAAVVLDRSGSMAEELGSREKINAAITGGQLFVHLSREDVEDRLTTIKFNEYPELIRAITEITSENKSWIAGELSPSELQPQGSTAVAGGIWVALQELDKPRPTPPPVLKRVMVVLTDGKDNTAYQNPDDGRWYSLLGGQAAAPGTNWFLPDIVMTEPVPVPADVTVHGIGLGTNENVLVGGLEALCSERDDPFRVVSDLTGPTYFQLEKHFTEIYMDSVDIALILDPVYTIDAQREYRIDFDVLRGDVSALVVMYDRDAMRLPFYLETPGGEIIEARSLPTGFQLRAGATMNSRFMEVRMPEGEPNRYAGRWHVIVNHPGTVVQGNIDYPLHVVNLLWGFVPATGQSHTVDHALDFGIAIGVGSNLRFQPYVTPGIVHSGEPLLLSGVVQEAGLPVTNCKVTVAATSPSGTRWQITLRDDGMHDDGDADDGEYAALFTHTEEAGAYNLLFRAEGRSRDGAPMVREATRSKYIEGRLPIEPDPGNPAEFQQVCCRRITWLLILGLLLLLMIYLILLFRL